MKIDAIALHQLKLPLKVPYKVSQKTFDEFMPIIVEARGAGGETGWGEALITTGYTQETLDSGWRFCREHAAPLAGLDTAQARARLVQAIPGSPVAISAMLAALDMMERDPLLTIAAPATIPLLAPCQSREPAAIRDEVESLLAQGFRTFKVKVGFDVEADLARVRAIGEAANGRARLRLDANRAFTAAQGCAFASRLDPASVELFEQPCASADWDANAAVAKASAVPVMLDESIFGIADIERAATLEGVGCVKLKLKKIGSVSMLEAALRRIRELGMEPVLGDGVSVQIACWMEACVARTTIANAGEMNGFLKANVPLFANPLPFARGAIELPAGYWPQVDEAVLARYRTRTERFATARVSA